MDLQCVTEYSRVTGRLSALPDPRVLWKRSAAPSSACKEKPDSVQIARAHGRSPSCDLMQRLRAVIERKLTRRVWNAIDRSEPKKWRRIVAEHAPYRPHLLSGASKGPKIGPKLNLFVILS